LRRQLRLAQREPTLPAQDWDKWESVFTADAFLDYNEAFPGFEGSPKVMAAFYDKLLYFVGAPSVHLVANIEIEFTGPDSAKVRAMVYNPMMIRMLPLYPAYTFVGYYHHDMKRIGGRWKSTHLREEAGWNSAPNVAIYLVIGYGMYRLARPAAAAAKAKAKAG
jgi:hypothetical protein